jgi:hypothetical protein
VGKLTGEAGFENGHDGGSQHTPELHCSTASQQAVLLNLRPISELRQIGAY